MNYSLMEPQAEEVLLPLARDRGMAVIINRPFMCVLTETTNPEHMEENIRAGLGRLPTEAERRRMRGVVESF